jgi:small conductance mechanosensitive channel
LVLVCLLGIGQGAAAQTVTVHPATVTPPGKTTPAKATAGAIIPGSPLAVLTGAGTAPDTATPYGSEGFGIGLSSALADDAKRVVGEGIAAVQKSTRLTPVWQWLQTVPGDTAAQARGLDAALALAVAFVPAVVVELLLRLGLRRLMLGAVLRAAAGRPDLAEAPDLAAASDADDAVAPVPDPDNQALDDAEAGATEAMPRREAATAIIRQLLFGLFRALLMALPLLGFALVIQGLIMAGLLTSRPGHLAVIGIGNAYLVCRGVMLVVRLLVAPSAPTLRMIPVTTEGARRTCRWATVVLSTIFFGYVLVSFCEIMGLDHTGARVLTGLIALAGHLEVAAGIWVSRRTIRRWIAGPRDAPGTIALLRQGFARVWHVFALFYVLALWVAFAAGVHNAFGVLLRVILVVILGATLGRLAWMGSSALLERALPDPSVSPARHPALFARARAYNPLLRMLIRLAIGALVILVILQGWGVDAFGFLATNHLSRSLLAALWFILITITVTLVLWEWLNALGNGWIEGLAAKGRTRQASRLRTLMPLFRSAIALVLVLTAGIICLSRLGVNATPLLAISSVVGIAVGFGSQKLVQDIITGLFLLLEDAMQVGDSVTLGGMSGTVERLSIRTIRLRGGDGSMNIIPFSSVTTVTNMTRDFGYAQISLEVGYEEDLDHVYAVLTDIAKSMRAEPRWGAMMRDDLQIFGLDQFGASALVITGQIRTGPGQQANVRREFYQRVKQRFDAEGIELPYTYLAPAPPRVAPPAETKAISGPQPEE